MEMQRTQWERKKFKNSARCTLYAENEMRIFANSVSVWAQLKHALAPDEARFFML